MPNVPRRALNSLALLGATPEQEAIYREAMAHSGESVEGVSARVGLTEDELRETLALFVELGLVSFSATHVTAYPPSSAIAGLLGGQATTLRAVAERLDELVDAMPKLRAAYRPTASDIRLDGEPRQDDNLAGLLESWISEATGDLLWFRPTAWALPREPHVEETVDRAVGRGIRSRAIYPASALAHDPEALHARAAAGEEVRVVPELPARLAIVVGCGALLPAAWTPTAERLLVVTEQVLADALTSLFEQMWATAIVVPGPADDGAARALLLRELAAGAKDEQIARALGLGLRTVRRRVAELLDELGVETRFQAGVEAVRRGWL